jgi:hypothetical protein
VPEGSIPMASKMAAWTWTFDIAEVKTPMLRERIAHMKPPVVPPESVRQTTCLVTSEASSTSW